MKIGRTNRLIGATLLVSGTTIGGGVLALPVTTGLAGFFPSLLLLIAIWLFMLLTAFYLLEVNLRLPGESNLISMVHETLGKPGEVVAWISYLLLLYSLLSAYLLGCSQILYDFLCPCFFEEIPIHFLLFGLFILFGGFVYLGVESVDVFNRLLMLGLIVGYIGLLALGLPRIQLSHLLYHNTALLPLSVSVIVTSFGFHIIIPTLTEYLEHDKQALKKVLLWGSFIPLVCYILWQLLAMGVIPVHGALSIESAYKEGVQATVTLRKIIDSPWVTLSARLFGFFAIITSLLGVSLSLSDFLADGLKIKKIKRGNLS